MVVGWWLPRWREKEGLRSRGNGVLYGREDRVSMARGRRYVLASASQRWPAGGVRTAGVECGAGTLRDNEERRVGLRRDSAGQWPARVHVVLPAGLIPFAC